MTMKLLLIVCVSLVYSVTSLELDEHWLNFQSAYNKQYGGMEEALRRRGTWEKNLQFIMKHNMEADMGKHTFHLGMNEHADMTDDEYGQFLTGLMMSNDTKSSGTFMKPNNVNEPDTMDWRDKGYVTPVKDQGHCGSCWAFSATGSLEGQHFKKTGKLVSLSEQNLVDCSMKEGNHGCMGGMMDLAFNYIKINDGLDTEMSYPYQMKNMPCRFKKMDVGATDTGYMDIMRGNEPDLKTAVATIGPISVAIDASRSTFRFFKHGVYSDNKCSSTKLDHGVLAVGYGTSMGMDYWLVKNSWGTSWGMSGYVMMARNKNNMCGIATQASYPLV